MNKYPFFKYITGNSKVHLMNSKLKIICFLITLLSILLFKDYVSLFIISIFILFLCLCSKLSINAYVSNILRIWPLYILFSLVFLVISFNLSFSILVVLKVILVITLFLILTFTTSLSEIAWGFECLFEKLKKIKIPVSKISLKIAMDIKFISTIFEQSRHIRKSMAYRGIPYSKNSLSMFIKMFVPVISISYRNSRRMAKTMKLRFYGSTKRRTNYHENKVTKYDKVLVFASFVILYLIIWLGWC